MKRVALFVGLLALSVPSLAQTASETIDVSLINLDLFVTDKNGNRVHGLTRDDFEVRENGKLQPITNFTEYVPEPEANGGDVSVSGPAAQHVPESKRTIVIFIDRSSEPNREVQRVLDGLREFMRRSVRPGDRVSVIAYEGRPVMLQAPTDDLGALDQALSRALGRVIDPRDQSLAGRDVQAGRESDEASTAAAAAMGMRGDRLSVAQFESEAAEALDAIEMRKKSASLTWIMDSLAAVEGKKIMVLALTRFGVFPGEGLGVEVRPREERYEKVRRAVMRSANANGFTLYPLYVPGARTGPDTGESHAAFLNQTWSMKEIADETGGLMAAGPSDIVDLLPHVNNDLDTYYSLAYRVTDSRPNVSRKVVVTAKNRDYRVRSRRSIMEKSDEQQMDDRVMANLFQASDYSLLPVRLELGKVRPGRRNRWLVPVTVKIPARRLAVHEQGSQLVGSFTVYVATGAGPGTNSEVQKRVQSFRFDRARAGALRTTDFTYSATIEFDQHPDAISVAVRDDISRDYGFARSDLERNSDSK